MWMRAEDGESPFLLSLASCVKRDMLSFRGSISRLTLGLPTPSLSK